MAGDRINMGKKKKLLSNIAGIFKGADFRVHRATEEGMLPSFLIYQVTKKCNSRCSFCSIWKQDPSNELTLGEIRDLFSDPFFSGIRWINLTGGEPFLRKGLKKVVKVFHRQMPELELIAIPSNGFATKRVLRGTRELLDVLDGDRLLNVNISIDGLDEAHERSRGVPGCFGRAMDSLKGLMALSRERKKLEVGVEVVITSENIDDLREIYDHLSEYTTHINFTPVIVGPSEYYGKPDKDVGLSREDVEKMAEFFEWLSHRLPAYSYYFEKVLDIKMEERGGERTYPCLGGYKTMFLDSKGEVFPCVIAPNHLRLGNIRERDPADIWFSEEATLMRRALKKWKYCKVCTNNCDIMANLKEETIDFLAFLLRNPRIAMAITRDIGRGRMDRYV